jgi:hypothetical protein
MLTVEAWAKGTTGTTATGGTYVLEIRAGVLRVLRVLQQAAQVHGDVLSRDDDRALRRVRLHQILQAREELSIHRWTLDTRRPTRPPLAAVRFLAQRHRCT